ncbi:hypothetical protein DNP08_23910, partial [Salmonella enterica subsp. enterica serovar Panama]
MVFAGAQCRKHCRWKRSHVNNPALKIYSQSAKEPRVLATNFPCEIRTPKQLVKIYSKRMQIEEPFRDLKSPAYGLGLRHSRTRSSELFDILVPFSPMLKLSFRIAGVYAMHQACVTHFPANTYTTSTLPPPFPQGPAASPPPCPPPPF